MPILGLITFGVFSLWGLGAAVTATFSSLRRELPQKPAAPPPPPVPGTPVMTPPAAADPELLHVIEEVVDRRVVAVADAADEWREGTPSTCVSNREPGKRRREAVAVAL